MENDDKIISRVVIVATEFKEFPKWFTDKFRSWKPEAREKYFRFVLPLIGFKHVGKGLAGLGAMWLTGERRTPEFLRENDRIIKGGPIRIIPWEYKMVFKSALRNKIVEYGEKIFEQGFKGMIISEGSLELNKLCCLYLLPEFKPFQPGGESHIDFIAEKIPLPDGEAVVFLGLDIQISGLP